MTESDTDADMSTPPVSSALSTTTTSTLVSSLPHLITVKLSQENYLLWHAKMIPYLKGQRLYGYVDGSSSQTDQFITSTSASFSTSTLNPEYTQGIQQD